MGLFFNLFGSNGKDIDDAFKQMKNPSGDIIDDGQFNNSQNKPNPASYRTCRSSRTMLQCRHLKKDLQ